ncbi:MAG: diguanylate cyclase [Pseudomonadota bacterium]
MNAAQSNDLIFPVSDANDPIRILVADDEEIIRDVYEQVLTPEDANEPDPSQYELVFCEQALDALDEVEQSVEQGRPFAVAFLDIRMPPGHDGVWAAERMRKLDPHLEIVMVTAYSDVNPLDIAARVPPANQMLYLQKPFHSHEITQVASALAAKWRAHRSLNWNRIRLATAQRIARVGDWEWNPKTGEASWSPELTRILALPDTASDGKLATLWMGIAAQDLARVKDAINETLRDGTEQRVEYKVERNSEEIFFRLETVRVSSPSGDALRVVGSIQDITESKRYEKRIRYLAYHDPLTGLPNRAFLRRYLPFSLSQAARDKTKVAVLFLDLDGFKSINDTLGHDAGDEVLKAVAERISKSVRDGDCTTRLDTMSKRETVTRLAGDEFILVLNDISDSDSAVMVAERVITAISEPMQVNGQSLQCGTSVGIAVFPEDGNDADSMLKAADAAMYAAKKDGRNLHVLYSELQALSKSA